MRPSAMMRMTKMVTAMSAITILGACSYSGDSLSAEAEQGRRQAQDVGCFSCHGEDGRGGIGPAWTGLHGSDVELDDGRVVVADQSYLTRSILEPGVDTVAGYTIDMPENTLGSTQIAAIVAYIKELE